MADHEAVPPASEGAVGPTDAATRAYWWCRDRIDPLVPTRTGPDTPLPWRVILFCALATMVPGLVLHPAFSLAIHAEGMQYQVPPGRLALSIVSGAWLGALLGLGLAAMDRWAGSWPRTWRWAVGAGVLATVLRYFIPEPDRWWAWIVGVRANGLAALLGGLIHGWFGWYALAEIALGRGFLGFWLARTIRRGGSSVGALAWAGLQSGAVALSVSLPVRVAVIWAAAHHAAGPRLMHLATQEASAVLYLLLAFTGTGVAVALALRGSEGREAEPPAPGGEA